MIFWFLSASTLLLSKCLSCLRHHHLCLYVQETEAIHDLPTPILQTCNSHEEEDPTENGLIP
ncbi:hypothetical protein M758_12G046900 [Ceratodon purpureus]|uniref:Uncharacterized protein n=1 Tax=Ceratodon purpureus TaxID=3225 RepID=A0A8T0G9A7_CERPU|nr:hypothetical protein KC19_12G044200 [Ceratodon purpureus]KAG0598108.1 hypothetical protein M758_12G046900 [Ceratodon purpureus]